MSEALATEQTEAVAIVEDVLSLREVRATASYWSEQALNAQLRHRRSPDYCREMAKKHRDAEALAIAASRNLEERLTRWSQTYRPALWR